MVSHAHGQSLRTFFAHFTLCSWIVSRREVSRFRLGCGSTGLPAYKYRPPPLTSRTNLNDSIMASSSKKPSTTERKRPRAETESRGSDPTATSTAPAKASAPTVTSPRRPPAKRPKTVKLPKEQAALKMAPQVIAAGPARAKGKGIAKASSSSGDAPLYIGGSESSDDDHPPRKHAERPQHSPTPSASEDDDLTTSLHARTKAAAVMAGIAVPPGSRRDRFKKRYMQYSAEKTLGMSRMDCF